jgi:hypothetical protein
MNSRRTRLTTIRTKISDSRMPRIVQAASTPGIVSRKVPLNCLAIGGGAPWPSMIFSLPA